MIRKKKGAACCAPTSEFCRLTAFSNFPADSTYPVPGILPFSSGNPDPRYSPALLLSLNLTAGRKAPCAAERACSALHTDGPAANLRTRPLERLLSRLLALTASLRLWGCLLLRLLWRSDRSTDYRVFRQGIELQRPPHPPLVSPPPWERILRRVKSCSG